MSIQRRQFMQLAGTWFLTAGLPIPALSQVNPASYVSFPQGIASGDPRTHSVILWTRAISSSANAGASATALTVQVSEQDDFSQVLVEEKVAAIPRDDFTVRAHISGLNPGRHYFYRFLADEGGSSATGRTMTAPAADSEQAVSMAFASCQNYEQGFFVAWENLVTEDLKRPTAEQIQFVLHLGDFIYERYRYDQKGSERRVRRLPDFPDGASEGRFFWADSLADYRHLYKTYLSDPHLQAARARWPFICTWDDHEFSNNRVRHFSTYNNTLKPESQRKVSASKAWFEYIPAAVEDDPENLSIYRQLRWGKQIDLLLTDLRSYRSAPPVPHEIEEAIGDLLPAELVKALDAGENYNRGEPPEILQIGEQNYPNVARQRAPGTMLGAQQKNWFKAKLKQSDATWKVWANALPLVPFRLDLEKIPFTDMHTSVMGQDAWCGYPGEYNELMQYLADQGINNVISLSGDHHTQGAGTLAVDVDAEQPEFVAVDFNVTGISSTPQYTGVLDLGRKGNPDLLQLIAKESEGEIKETWNMTFTHGVIATMAYSRLGMHSLSDWLGPNRANPGLKYVDSNSNGYGLATFNGEECRVQLVTIEPPLQNQASGIRRSANFRVSAWSENNQPELEGPEFSGQPPFPFS